MITEHDYIVGLDVLTGLCRSLSLLPLDAMVTFNEPSRLRQEINMTLRVTVEDLQTGDVSSAEVAEGDYLLICHDPCWLKSTETSNNDSRHVLTVVGRLKNAKSRVKRNG